MPFPAPINPLAKVASAAYYIPASPRRARRRILLAYRVILCTRSTKTLVNGPAPRVFFWSTVQFGFCEASNQGEVVSSACGTKVRRGKPCVISAAVNWKLCVMTADVSAAAEAMTVATTRLNEAALGGPICCCVGATVNGYRYVMVTAAPGNDNSESATKT